MLHSFVAAQMESRKADHVAVREYVCIKGYKKEKKLLIGIAQ